MRRQRLIDARKRAGKNQEDVAAQVGVDRTTIGKWERDESTPHPNQRPAYAEALGMTLHEMAAELSTVAAEDDGVAPEWVNLYLAMEQSAEDMRVYEADVVHGLLQAPRYTRELVRRNGLVGMSDAYARDKVDQRRIRQRRVRDGGLVLDVIQAEQVLRTEIGGAEVMAEQLRAMVTCATLPTVTIRVVPFGAGQYEARRMTNLVIMKHPWGTPRVWIEGYGGGRFITDTAEVDYFVATFGQAAELALTPDESSAFLGEVAAQWEARR